MAIETTQSVREIVQQHPAAVRVFEAHGIDYCCGGKKTLEEACSTKHVPVGEVISALVAELAAGSTADDEQWMDAPLKKLTRHITERYHERAKSELPRLSVLAEKVRTRHGHAHPELHQLQELVQTISSETLTHMLKEEQVLFPRIVAIEQAAEKGATPGPAFFGALINPIRHMMSDHDDTGVLLTSIRNITHDYTPPEGACMSYQALYHGLLDFEKDTHQHIHLENNVLFPRAMEMERAPAA